MKIVEIVPRHRAHLYDTLVEKEAAIRKAGRGTYTRIGRKVRGSTKWKHKTYKGSIQLSHSQSEVVTAKVRANSAEDERKLLSSFLGFVDRHSGDHVDTINIQYADFAGTPTLSLPLRLRGVPFHYSFDVPL
jgi:hypothetical protein